MALQGSCCVAKALDDGRATPPVVHGAGALMRADHGHGASAVGGAHGQGGQPGEAPAGAGLRRSPTN
jgi:hypothetical protein